MQGVLMVLILCIGAVWSQGPAGPPGPPGDAPQGYPARPPGPQRDPPGPPDTAGFYVPELPLLPPQPVPNNCYRRFGPYAQTDVTLSPQTFGTMHYFYHQCFYYRPSYSECTGGCSSRHRVYIDSHPDPSYDPSYRLRKTCKCCEAQRYLRVPVRQVYCRYVFQYNTGCPQTVTNRWVTRHPDISALRYYVVDQCRCLDCPRRLNNFMVGIPAQRSLIPNMDPNFPDEFVGLQGMDVGIDDEVEGLRLPNTVLSSFNQWEVDQLRAEHQRSLILPPCFSAPS